MATDRGCLNSPDVFCYVCGTYVLRKDCRIRINDDHMKTYYRYFGMQLGDQDKSWAPHIICANCHTTFKKWTKGESSFKFGVPMVWREPTDHVTNCYFCMVKTRGFSGKNKHLIQYPSLPSAIRPVPHSTAVPIPLPVPLGSNARLEEWTQHTNEDQPVLPAEGNEESLLPGQSSSSTSFRFDQDELNDLVRDLGLSKTNSELLASRLKEKDALSPGTSITFYRTREEESLVFFSEYSTGNGNFVYCDNVKGLLIHMGVKNYEPDEWRLFIDSSKRSLKCVLLHNGNKYASVPIGHSIHMKEKYEEIKTVIKLIKYNEHYWIICVDLKMVNFLLGQQSGYTKYPCFLCLWDSRARLEHWVRKDWPSREKLEVGKNNVINEPLVNRQKIVFPPLHIKLGLMKQIVKALNKDGDCFVYICNAFPGLSDEKKKAGVFDGPQIRQLIRDDRFPLSMTQVEKDVWDAFVKVTENFLGNVKADNYVDLVNDLHDKLHKLGINMSIKVHFLFSHIDRFPENLGAVSDEQGERFHQDIKVMEARYQGRWDSHMMADYCWNIMRDCVGSIHSRKSKKTKFMPDTE